MLALVLTGAIYARGWRSLRERDPERWRPSQLASFAGALIALLAALASPIEPFSSLLLCVHMLQHLLLTMVVPPLVWLAAPQFPLLRGLPVPLRDFVAPLLGSAEVRWLGHLLARPHVLAMPVMVMWVGGLIAAADRRGAPSFWLLPLIALWANLHGGFVFGLMLIGPIGLTSIPLRRFAALNALACLIWSAIFTTIGYLFGPTVDRILTALAPHKTELLIALPLPGSCFLIWLLWRRHRQRIAALVKHGAEQPAGIDAEDAMLQVLLARADQLDRHAYRLGRMHRLHDIVGHDLAAEAAAQERHVHFHGVGFYADRSRDGLLAGRDRLDRPPHLDRAVLIRGSFVHRFERRVGIPRSGLHHGLQRPGGGRKQLRQQQPARIDRHAITQLRRASCDLPDLHPALR